MSQKPSDFIPYTQPIGKRPDSKFKDLTGQKFHWLTIKERATNNPKGQSRWLCECDCGTQKVIKTCHLVANKTKSCGCKVAHLVSTTERKPSDTRSIWNGIKERIYCPSTPSYRHYNARGIRMCHGWKSSFESFLADMGERPEGKTIDRIDNEGHYSCGHCEECIYEEWPKNCKWSTPREQQRNRRITKWVEHQGLSKPLSEWIEELNLVPWKVRSRIAQGMDVERAFAESKVIGEP